MQCCKENTMSQFALRLPDSLHERARALAQQDNALLNQFIALAAVYTRRQKKVSALETAPFFRERAARGHSKDALAVLDKGPRVPPLPGDEMPH
jgi:hypothetical protein